MTTGSPAQRLRQQLPLTGVLVVAWVLLWGSWSPANLLSGVLVAVLTVVVLPVPSVTAGVRLRPVGLLALVGHVLADLVVSSVQIAWQALRPSGPGGMALVVVRLRTDSDVLQTSVAQALTLVPGSIVLEVDREDRSLAVHVLQAGDRVDVTAEREAVLALEARIVRAFGTDADLAALRHRPAGPVRRAAEEGS